MATQEDIAVKPERKTDYELLRESNIRQMESRYTVAFKDLIEAGLMKPFRRDASCSSTITPPPRKHRAYKKKVKVPAEALRRSQRLKSKSKPYKQPTKGFMGFPPSELMYFTNMWGKFIAVHLTEEEKMDCEAVGGSSTFTAVFCKIPLEHLQGIVPPEIDGNGWFNGEELGSDEEVDVDMDVDMAPEMTFRDRSVQKRSPASQSRRSASSQRRISPPRLNVEDVTPGLIRWINYTARKTRIGICTTCHQCRQKTDDTKSICRSGKCQGLRGMFCGYCLIQRYGEDVADVLQDPKWECPVCRGICNCSVCRSRQKLPPTGALFPIAKEEGYVCVADYLKDHEKDLL